MQKQPRKNKQYICIIGLFVSIAMGIAAASAYYFIEVKGKQENKEQEFKATTFAMDTIVTQTAYGPNATNAMQEVNIALADYEARLSMFSSESDVNKIANGAGGEGAEVSPDTAALLRQAQELSQTSEGVFAVTIAPLTQAWGITGDSPRVVPQEELDELLRLVDDSRMQIKGNHVLLAEKGMGLDLGGIAKGAACSLVADIYEKNGVERAVLSIGGNVYVRGTKPDGTLFRVGFRDPERGEGAYIASFAMQDEVIAVSGGYERYFEQDGKKYIHIINAKTGMPAESDIVSVGVLHEDGAVADFYSTTLFIGGKDKTLSYMESGGRVIMLDKEKNLYVSESLREDFLMHEENTEEYTEEYTLVFVSEAKDAK